MKTIYLVRHCSAEGQHKDSPLTNEGLIQAQSLSRFFMNEKVSMDKIISSPYLRAIESIKPYAEALNLTIEIDHRLKERIVSEEPIDDWLEVLENSFQDYDFRLHGGESSNDVIDRANQVLQCLNTDGQIKNLIIVSHGNLIALLLSQLDRANGFTTWKELRNPDVYKITYDNGIRSIKCIWQPTQSLVNRMSK